jgi:hypothetical protein
MCEGSGRKQMQNLTFDIFSGELERDARWLEAVQGLDSAKDRMKQIASETPGKYFIFCTSYRSVVETIETFNGSSSAAKASTART